jgi:hypothetical protein
MSVINLDKKTVKKEQYLPFAAHEFAYSTRFSPTETAEFGSSTRAKELAEPSSDDDSDGITPYFASVKKTKVGRKSRQSKIL